MHIAVMEEYGSIVVEHVDSFELSRRNGYSGHHFRLVGYIRTHEDSTPSVFTNLLDCGAAVLHICVHCDHCGPFMGEAMGHGTSQTNSSSSNNRYFS
jgi:hypothetical protein